MNGSLQAEALVQKLVAAIDEEVAEQLCTIIQHPRFKALESLWRGLLYMMDAVPGVAPVRVRLLSMSWAELSHDLNLSTSIQTSVLFRLVNRQELNTLGGHPFGLLVVDQAITTEVDEVTGYDDLYTLQLLAELGQESLCPVVMTVSKNFLGTSDIDVWTDPERVQRILNSQDFAGWRRLRSLGCSRFLGLAFPKVLLRTPWQHCYQGILFNEHPVYGVGSDYLWGNSAFAFAGNVLQEFNRIRWFGFLRVPGERGGALVKKRATVSAAAWLRLTDSLEEFYSGQGFIPLTTVYLSGDLAFFSNCSLHQSGWEGDDLRIINMLQTTLIGCRFGHYLKVLIREHIGSYDSAVSCQRELNTWLQGYTSNADYADDSVLASYPLKKSRVTIHGNESLGIYYCEVELQPQYQFDVINSSLLLKTDTSELRETE